VIRRGDLAVAVSTSGASPAATRAIREELEDYFTDDYARFVEVASEARRQLREKSVAVSGAAWNRALKGDFRRLIREGRVAEAKKVLLETLEAGLCP
jgi:siroheme synthase-like protein